MKNIDKILQYIELQGYSVSEFERMAKLGGSYLPNTHKRGADISRKALIKIQKNLPKDFLKIFPEEATSKDFENAGVDLLKTVLTMDDHLFAGIPKQEFLEKEKLQQEADILLDPDSPEYRTRLRETTYQNMYLSMQVHMLRKIIATQDELIKQLKGSNDNETKASA